MTLSKVVRKGNYRGVAQWGINTSSEITPSRKTAQKWAELASAAAKMAHNWRNNPIPQFTLDHENPNHL